MTGYTIKNLKDVEDSAVGFGLSPSMEARFAKDVLGCEQTGLSYQRFAPGFRQPFAHRHARDEEVYVVVGGAGRVWLDGEVAEIARWDAVRVAPGTVRAFAAGPEGLEILAFGPRTPNDFSVEPAWPEEGESAG